MRNSIKISLSIVLMLSASSHAFAQQQGGDPLFIPPASNQAVQGSGNVSLPTSAPLPQQPDGGMSTAPTVGAEDPAMRMTLEGGNNYVDTLNSASTQRLENLLSNQGSGISGSELEQMMQLRRSNILLSLKQEEAELAVGLWGVLFNNEHAQAWRSREDSIESARRDRETAAAELAAENSTQPILSTVEQLPVVYEIMNGAATILVPGGGEVQARAGTTLPNGMKVISIGSSVIVEKSDGSRISLGFGTTIAPPDRGPGILPMATPLGAMY